jgi:hypothetical protein
MQIIPFFLIGACVAFFPNGSELAEETNSQNGTINQICNFMLNTTYYINECDYQCFCSTNCTSKDNATIVNTVDCQPKEQNPVFHNVATGCWVFFGVFLLGMIVTVEINDPCTENMYNFLYPQIEI